MSKVDRKIENFTHLFRYPRIVSALKQERKLYLFFPSWSFGGAERVHLDILKLFPDLNPLCFITERSITDGFKKDFQNLAETIELGRWSEKEAYKIILFKKIAKRINSQNTVTVFGWGNRYFYQLIPYLASHVKIIDIIHNFVEGNQGIEYYSLPHISRINHRVVVGENLVEMIKKHYCSNQISMNYLERVVLIKNKLPTINETPIRDYCGNLQVLFVGRNSVEKRPDIFVKVAAYFSKKKFPITFNLIGDFLKSEIYSSIQNLNLIGILASQDELAHQYRNAHLLILPSKRESWGLVVFEAMSYGVVPITTNVGDLGTILTPAKENGVVIDDNQDELVIINNFIKQIVHFTNDRDRLERFSKNAFKTIVEMSSNEMFEKSYKELFNDET